MVCSGHTTNAKGIARLAANKECLRISTPRHAQQFTVNAYKATIRLFTSNIIYCHFLDLSSSPVILYYNTNIMLLHSHNSNTLFHQLTKDTSHLGL